jgi:fatty acid desaturase
MLANTRTTYTTAIVRFLAWTLPYHTEHHVWPAVPFHQLPALHDRLQAHLQVTADGYAAFTRDYLARRVPLRAAGGSGKAQDRPHHGDNL